MTNFTLKLTNLSSIECFICVDIDVINSLGKYPILKLSDNLSFQS